MGMGRSPKAKEVVATDIDNCMEFSPHLVRSNVIPQVLVSSDGNESPPLYGGAISSPAVSINGLSVIDLTTSDGVLSQAYG